MGLMNAIGLQPRNPTTSVTSQGTQTLALQLQNAETQTEGEVQEPATAASGPDEGGNRAALEGESDLGRELGTSPALPERPGPRLQTLNVDPSPARKSAPPMSG